MFLFGELLLVHRADPIRRSGLVPSRAAHVVLWIGTMLSWRYPFVYLNVVIESDLSKTKCQVTFYFAPRFYMFSSPEKKMIYHFSGGTSL